MRRPLASHLLACSNPCPACCHSLANCSMKYMWSRNRKAVLVLLSWLMLLMKLSP
jgi:hypothetical protein